MRAAILDERKIDKLVMSYKDAEQIISEGSDQHLDIILRIQKSVKKVIELSIVVNEELESTFNTMNEENAKTTVLKLSLGLRMAKQLITILRMHPLISEALKSSRKELYLETKQIDEFVQDIIKYKLNDTQDLKDLLIAIK